MTELNKENITDQIDSISERSKSLKIKAIADAETNWEVTTSKEYALDCSQPGSDVHGVDQLSKELEKVLTSLDGENSLSNILHNNENQRVKLQHQLEKAKETTKAMKLVEGLGRDMELVDEVLSIGDFKEAVTQILALETKLSLLVEDSSSQLGELVKVVVLVQEQLFLRRAEASSSLKALWRKAIFIDRDHRVEEKRKLIVYTVLSGHIAGQYLQKAITLQQVWWCLERLGSESLLSECCNYLCRNFLLTMVSVEIAHIKRTTSKEKVARSLISFEQFSDATGEQSVVSLLPLDDDPPNEETVDPTTESEAALSETQDSGRMSALRVPVVSKITDAQAIEVSSSLKPTLLFLGDICQVLQFVSEKIFHGSLRFSARAGLQLLGQGSEQGDLLRALCAVLEVATESRDTSDLASLKVAVEELEQKLFDLGFLADLPSSQKECDILGLVPVLPATPLSIFVARLPVVWANRLREKVLEQMRSQLVSGDYHNSVDSEGLFTQPLAFPSCQVTAICAELLLKCQQTMEAACDQSDSLSANTLFRAARELLDLFRAVIPQRHSEALATLPRLAALFHNDCLFLSHACLTLAHPYRSRLPAPLNKTATCVDLAPVLRELGEQTLLRQIAVQQEQLDSFAQVQVAWVPEDEASAGPESAVKACVFHLHHLAHLWQPCLSAQVYGKVMGRLLKHASTPLLEAILCCEDIAESATHRLYAVLTDLCEAKAALIGADHPLGEWWQRLYAIKQLMVWSLDDINEQLSSGTFCNFSSLELCQLMEALFEQSEKLDRTLTAVRKA